MSPLPRRYSVRHIETNTWELMVTASSADEAEALAEAEYQACGFESFNCIAGDTNILVKCISRKEARS
jgi:hypothetical protein